MDGDVVAALRRAVQAAGHELSVLSCGGMREMAGCIRSLRAETEFVVLDPGDLVRQPLDADLHEALDALAAPYIDIHDDSAATLASPDGLHHAPLATIVIQGDLSASYRIAMGIALRQLAA